MFFALFLQILVIFAEGLGISMVLPLLTSLGFSNRSDSGLINFVYDTLALVGAENSLVVILLFIGTLFFIKSIFVLAEKIYQGYLQSILMKELKYKIFSATNSMDYLYYTKRSTGHFINIMNEQITRFFLSFKGYMGFFTNSVMVMGYLIFSVFISWEFVLLAIFSSFFILIAFRYLNKFMRMISRKSASETSNLNKLLVQSIHSFKYIVSTEQGKKIKIEVNSSIRKLMKLLFQENVANAITVAVREPLLITFIIIIVSVQLIYLQRDIGPIIVVILLFHRAIGSVLNIQSSWLGAMSMMGSVELVDNEFKMLNQNKELGGKITMPEFSSVIELKNVTFSYGTEDTPVFKNINIRIPANKTIAILGESGMGKTTLIDMITLLLKPQSGNVRIDGVDALDLQLSSWRKQIGYVSQDPVVFDDTIANNISMWTGDPNNNLILMKRIEKAAKQANIAEYIETLNDRFSTNVGDRGIRLSGGQKQRLCIARELFKNPKLLILDEATSALDSDSEKYIKQSIDDLRGQMTVIQIAHRLSTIQNADYIYILGNGTVLEEGSYKDLSKRSESKLGILLDQQRL